MSQELIKLQSFIRSSLTKPLIKHISMTKQNNFQSLRPNFIQRFDIKKKKLMIAISKSILLSMGIVNLSVVNDLPAKSLPNLLNKNNEITKGSFVAKAVERTGPAVVTIDTQRKVRTISNNGLPPNLLMDPYLQRFFGIEGIGVPKTRIEKGQGSGVIFQSNGLVLTNAHVIEKTDILMVELTDGRRIKGEIVGKDSLTDLAVIRLNGNGPWPVAPLGNSDQLKVGEWAIAVGNPFGLENTVTLGIISNLNRNVAQLGISDKRLELIQTDAAINPGNSGGPLLNENGEVVGINTLVRSGPGAGLGFAIPINRALEIARQLIEKGNVTHPVIGISLGQLTSNNINESNRNGAIIRYVVPGGPAYKGGLQAGDIIHSIGGKKIKNPAQVVTAISRHGINTKLEFQIKRKEKKFTILIQPVDFRDISYENK